MLRAAIDIALLLILCYCTWVGSKKGIIGGAAGLLAIVVSLYAGSLLSSAFSGEILPAFEPFTSGIIESKEDAAIARMEYGSVSLEDIVRENPDEGLRYSQNVYEELGIHPKRADDMAKQAAELSETGGMTISKAVERVFCVDMIYVAGTILSGALVLILLTVIGSLINLRFHIPSLPGLDYYGGVAMGFLRGMAYCILLCWLMSFMGMLLGDVLSQSLLTKFFLLFDFLTGAIL